MLDVTLIFVATVLLVVASYHRKQEKAYRVRILPPGPPGIPFFGNLFQVPALRPYPKVLFVFFSPEYRSILIAFDYLKFREWAKQYGSIFRLRLGPQNMIVLNTAEAADELLVNRSNNFSSRSPPHVAHDIMSAGQRQVFLPYGREWKVNIISHIYHDRAHTYQACRRSLQTSIAPGPSKQLRPLQELESCVLLHDFLTHGETSLGVLSEDPTSEVPEGHWFSLVRRYVSVPSIKNASVC